MSKLTTIVGTAMIIAGAAGIGYVAGKYQHELEDFLEEDMQIIPTIHSLFCGDGAYSATDVAYYMRSLNTDELNYFFTQMSPDPNLLFAEIGFEYLSLKQKQDALHLMRTQVEYNQKREYNE